MNAESRTTRRLAAILAADVVGYSRLMGIDEEGTLAALKAHRKELIDPLIAQHQGRIVKTTGDGLLMEFASIVDAVRCAVVMQQGIESRNANVDESRRIRFRVGINVGDVIVEGDDIFGDGVNVAARLEALAEPGRICVSATVREHVAEKLPIGFADLGEHSVKNIARPVHVFRIETRIEPKSASMTADPRKRCWRFPTGPRSPYCPFTNLSGDPEQDYLADGMVEDIITGLSRIKWLFVIARNSSFAYKGKAVNVKQAGRELGVRYILEGSVRKASNRVRVTGQLIEAETGRHVWADRYDRTLDDVFAIQDELTMSVVAAIEPSLRQAEIERVKRKRPDSLDAYDLVLRAIPYVYTAMPEGAAKALPLLESALKMEPDYALAHGFAAWAHEIIFARGGTHEENRLGAVRHAQAAIAHGRDDALALSLGGFALGLVAHDREAAQQAFEAALGAEPVLRADLCLGQRGHGLCRQCGPRYRMGRAGAPFEPVRSDELRRRCFAITLGHLQRGEYEAAADGRAQGVPGQSFLEPGARAAGGNASQDSGGWARPSPPPSACSSFSPVLRSADCAPPSILHPSLATPLSEALTEAGLPA